MFESWWCKIFDRSARLNTSDVGPATLPRLFGTWLAMSQNAGHFNGNRLVLILKHHI